MKPDSESPWQMICDFEWTSLTTSLVAAEAEKADRQLASGCLASTCTKKPDMSMPSNLLMSLRHLQATGCLMLG